MLRSKTLEKIDEMLLELERERNSYKHALERIRDTKYKSDIFARGVAENALKGAEE